MQYIGNIVTKTIFEDKGYYNVVSDIKDIITDIPTLIIGWGLTKSFFPNANILEHRINSNIYWTFGKREKRDKMEVDIVKFKTISIEFLCKSIPYSFFNALTKTKEEKTDFFNSVSDKEEKSCFFYNDMAYIYYKNKREIIGTSIRDIVYENGNADKFLSFLKNTASVSIVDKNSDTQNINFLLKNNIYLMSYILS